MIIFDEDQILSEIFASNTLRDKGVNLNIAISENGANIQKQRTFVDEAVDVVKATPGAVGDFGVGVAKGVPTGASKFGTEIMDTITNGAYSKSFIPFVNEKLPIIGDINNYINNLLKPEGTAQEVGSAIGEGVGQVVLPGAVGTKALQGANIGSTFLRNVLGYGSAEAIGMNAQDQGLLELGTSFFVSNDNLKQEIINSLKADEDQSVLMQKIQKAPQRFFEGGIVGEALGKALEGVGVLYRAMKGSDKIKNALQNIGEKAQGELDLDANTTTLSSMGGGEINTAINKGLAKLAPGKGIPFDKNITDNNVRLHKMRLDKVAEGVQYPGGPKNERTVIKAPNNNLPDFVVGKITFDDWIKRTEKLLTKEEIMIEKDWYDDVFKEFDKLAGEDQSTLRKIGEAWLSAQQNETPATAMTNVLHIFEQFKRGVPRSEVKGKGLPSANKIASDIIYGEKITGGAGQKISDFIDSGYKKTTRSIMGNNPDGGSPFVVDVHTARDTGLVDRKLVNHLKRLGYKVPDNIILDVGEGGIKGPMYENRAIFGRELTEHLNSISWQGKNDWTPQEVQAVGWMALSNKLTGEGGRSGNTATAMTRNTSRIAMEVDPGSGSPWAEKYGSRYSNLAENDRININNVVTKKAVELIAKDEGATLNTVIHGQGGWKQYSNPSTVMEGPITFDTAKQVANKLGYVLNQTEVLVHQMKPLTQNPQHFSVMLVSKGSSVTEKNNLDTLMKNLMELDEKGIVAQGYHPITLQDGRVGVNIVITKQTLTDAKKAKVIKSEKEGREYITSFVENDLSKMTDDLNFDVEVDIMESNAEFVGNNWEKDITGGSYKNNIRGNRGTNAEVDGESNIDLIGKELEEIFSGEISKAERKNRSTEGVDSDTPDLGGEDGST
tara:strand:- start:19016 stop:21691 length:2676 start_codon:yes stop_codon:yes gene_type:complete